MERLIEGIIVLLAALVIIILTVLIRFVQAVLAAVVIGGFVYLVRTIFGAELGNFFLYLQPYVVIAFLIEMVHLAYKVSSGSD